MPDLPRRKHLRLPNFDYAAPYVYFITAVTHQRQLLFGQIDNTDPDQVADMRCNSFGDIVWRTWLGLPQHYPHAALDAFIVMPNHIHALIRLLPYSDDDAEYGTAEPVARTSVGHIIRSLKSFSTRAINRLRQTPGGKVWQRDFYERVVRSERELDRLRDYIVHNPTRWAYDAENPDRRRNPS